MGFLSNLIGKIKNNFSDDKGLFQKNKFVGFGGANDYAKSQLDLGNSNIPLSSTQQPTYQQFKPQMETPVAQPSLNTTSSIDTLKNRIKSIQGLTQIKVKDPVPQIQPPEPTFASRVGNITSNVMNSAKQIAQTGANNLGAWGDVAKQGIKNQVDIQKRDFKDYVIDPMFNRPGENLGEGTFLSPVVDSYRRVIPSVVNQTKNIFKSPQEQDIGQNWEDAKNIGRATLTTAGLLASPALKLGSMVAGGIINPLATMVGNKLDGKKLFDDVSIDSVVQGAGTGLANSGTTRLTNYLVQGLSSSVPFLKPFTEKALKKSLPVATDTVKTAVKKLIKTGATKLIKGAVIETAVESPIWATLTQTEQESYIDALVRETKDNLIMNTTMAGISNISDIRSLTPIVKKSINTAIENYWKNISTTQALEAQSGKIDLGAKVGITDQPIKTGGDIIQSKSPAGFDNLTDNTFKTKGGELVITENTPSGNSVQKLYVDESARRQGIATRLLEEAKNKYNTISAQVSNEASVKLHYKSGFRPYDNPNATLNDSLDLFNNSKSSSINMVWNKPAGIDAKPNFLSQPIKTGEVSPISPESGSKVDGKLTPELETLLKNPDLQIQRLVEPWKTAPQFDDYDAWIRSLGNDSPIKRGADSQETFNEIMAINGKIINGKFMINPKTGDFIPDIVKKTQDELIGDAGHVGNFDDWQRRIGQEAARKLNYDDFVRGTIKDGKVNIYFDADKALNITDTQRIEALRTAAKSLIDKGQSPDLPVKVGMESWINPGEVIGEHIKANTLGELAGIKSNLSPESVSPIKTGENIKTDANIKKDIDLKTKLQANPDKIPAFIEGLKKAGYGEKQIASELKRLGVDTSNLNLKGEPTQISSIFDKYKVPEKPIDLVVSGQKVPVEQLKAEGWNENQINQAMKELDKDGSVPPEKIDSWIRKKLSDLYPKSAEKIKSGRKLPLPPEPTDSELVKMDRNASEILETPIKTEPKTSKVTTQEKIVNPSGSSEVVKAKPISDLGSKSKPISEIKPKTETQKVETEKVETPKTKVDDKFAGDKARLKYKNIDATTIRNKKLASAVANAKKLDEWEVNKNAIKSKVADNAWKKVSMIENGTWKEEKITVETMDRDTKEGTDALNKLIGKINQSETQSFDFASRSGLTDIKSQDTEKIINAIENTKAEGDEYSPEDIANIQKTKDFWKRALAIGKKLGLNIKETKNYFTHMYAEFQGSNMSGSKNLSQKTPFANSRKYSSYKEAFEKAGLTRAFNNISEFGTRYMQKNLTTKAKIDFLASLPFKNIEDIKDLGDDYKIVNKIKGVDIGENDRYLPAKLADMVNGYFGDENAFKSLEKASKVAKFFQNIKLNAGIPFTPANYYGIVQGFKEFTTELGQMVMGKKSPLQIHTFKNFARSFSRDNSIKWEKDNIKSIIKMKSVFRIDGEYNLKGLLEGGFWDSVKDKKYGEAINKAMGDATFKRFMFQNMVSSFKESEAKFVKSGMDEKTATKTALTLIEKLYGLQRVQAKYTGSGLEKILGNKNVSNALQTLLMAKDYKQQMSKMWWNMAKAIKNPGAPENQGVVAYGIGIALTKAAMETANYITTGKLMEENPENLKDKAVIGLPGSKSGLTLQSVPGTGFVPKTLFRMGKSMVTGKGDVGKQAGSFLSIPLGLGADLANNEDYFGNNIWDSSDTTGEKAKKVAGYSAKEVISPYVAGAKSLMSILNKKKNGDVEDIKDSEINDILKAIEFPMSYVSKDRFETLHFYDTKKEQYNKLTEDEKVIFDKIEKKGTDFASKQRDAVADAQDFVNYPAVLNAKKEIAIETAKKNGTEVDPLYKLTDAQLKTYYQIQGLRNNRDAQKALKDENEWYNELSGERSKYFDDLVASGKMKAQESDYPKASPEVQKKIDYLTALKTPELKKKQDYYYTLPKGTGARSAYIKANPDLLNYWNTKNAYNEANPDIQAFWDEVNAYNVKVDKAFGIKPEEYTTSSGSSGYSGWQNWGEKEPNVYTFLNKITGKVDSTLKKDINSIIKLSKKDKSSKELDALISKTYKNLSEIFERTKK